jgi:predicted transcriptional regulator of viral defense system
VPPQWIELLHGRASRATLLSMTATWESLPDTFSTRTARAHGVHPRTLYRWRDSGRVVELSRGIFRRVDAPPSSYPDLLAVAYRAPRAIVCCVSAAAVHDLTDELPVAVQIAIPSPDRPPQISHPPTEVFRFASDTFEVGLTGIDAAKGERVRIYDPARTVVDLMRLRDRFGDPLAYAALRRYLRRRDARPAQLLRLAEVFGVYGPVNTALDVAQAG